MPPTFVQRTPIDSEWAEALVGLRLNVPNSWWPGFVDGGLNRGRIAAVNLDALNEYYFEVKLDDELGAHYAMRYDSVLLYADEGQPGFSRFCLPMLCPGNPDDKMVRVKVLHGKNGGTMVDDDFTDKEAVDEGDDDVDFFDSRDDGVEDTDDADDGSYSKGAPAMNKKRKKGATMKKGVKRAAKRNKKCRHKINTTINPDSVMVSGEILEAGMGVLRKRRDDDGKLERHRTEVRCPAQTRDYCATFRLIDKGNGAEASYDLGGKSRLHNWSPKLVFRLYNMALNNAYKMYRALVKEHTPERRFLSMGNAVRELTHDLCQRGPAMRKLRAEHPSWTRDLGKLFGWVTGRKVRSNAKGMMTVMPACLPVEVAMDNYVLLKNQQRKSPWRMHQSEAVAKQGKCGWDDCPGKLASKAAYPRNSDTHMRCEECSAR